MADREDSVEHSVGYDGSLSRNGKSSPDEYAFMEGVISRSTHTTLLKRHLASFDKLLQYAMSRYSSEKLYEKLMMLNESIESLSKEENFLEKGEASCVNKITSVSELRQILKRIKRLCSRNSGGDNDLHVMHYFEAFLEDLQFLKELKRYFDEKIHRNLYEHFYDPIDDLDGAQLTDTKDETSSDNGITDKEKLCCAAKVLYDVSSKWDRVLEDDSIKQNDFDPDSLNAIQSFPRWEQFGPILRIIPDIFVKAFKVNDYAKTWLHCSHSVHKDTAKLWTAKEINKKELELKERVLSLTLEIGKIESNLEFEYQELKVLRHKENRHMELHEEQKRFTEMKNSADTRRAKLLNERDIFYSKNKMFLPQQTFRDKCMDIDIRILKAESDLKIISFQLSLLKEDYHLEVLLLPEIVRCILEVEENIRTLEASLKNKQFVRFRTENSLSVLKKNCNKMRDVIGKYNKRIYSGISIETNEAGDTLSISTCRSDTTPSDLGPSPDMRTSEDVGNPVASFQKIMVDKQTGMTPDQVDDW